MDEYKERESTYNRYIQPSSEAIKGVLISKLPQLERDLEDLEKAARPTRETLDLVFNI